MKIVLKKDYLSSMEAKRVKNKKKKRGDQAGSFYLHDANGPVFKLEWDTADHLLNYGGIPLSKIIGGMFTIFDASDIFTGKTRSVNTEPVFNKKPYVEILLDAMLQARDDKDSGFNPFETLTIINKKGKDEETITFSEFIDRYGKE